MISIRKMDQRAFDDDRLAGFGVLAHRRLGVTGDQLQVDLMYVSRQYRRQGIGRRIFQALSEIAAERGAKQLYISSTETESAVKFYSSMGSTLASEVDAELFEKEPDDIHLEKKLENGVRIHQEPEVTGGTP